LRVTKVESETWIDICRDRTEDSSWTSRLAIAPKAAGGMRMPDETRQDETVEIPEKTLGRLADAGLIEAQLDRLSNEVANRSQRMGDPTATNAYLTSLEKQRAALLAKRVLADVVIDFAQQRLDRSVVNIGDLLFPWAVLNLPYMTEGFYQTPGTPDATGD